MSRLLSALATFVIFATGLFFLLLALGGHLQLLEARTVMAEGRTAEGTVTALRRGGQKSASYYFSYEFPAGSAIQAKKDLSISYSDFHALRKGSNIKVWYDPASPAKSVTIPEMAEFESIPNRLFLPGIAVLLLGWWIARLVRRRPAPPAPPAQPAKPERVRYVSPVRRGE
jgi:hypothetical protein